MKDQASSVPDHRSLPLPSRITVSPASAAERPLIEGMFQFYAYDFSEIAAPDAAGFEFDDAGHYGAYPFMDTYWNDAERWPLLIRIDGRAVGFALVNALSHHDQPIDRNMGEFFVARRDRRSGVASEAARRIFALHPGRWEVAVALRNTTARAFWSKTIADAPAVSQIRVRDLEDARWHGPIWNFCIDAIADARSR